MAKVITKLFVTLLTMKQEVRFWILCSHWRKLDLREEQ